MPLFREEIAKIPTFSWSDPPLDPSWTKPDAALAGKIEEAVGLLAERFAFCQTMPLGGFLAIAEGLRQSGYRPIRFRPYADGQVVRVAAVWNRDGRKWRIADDQTADGISEHDAMNPQGGHHSPWMSPDIRRSGAVGSPADRYAALWAGEPVLMTMPVWSSRSPLANSRAHRHSFSKPR